MFASFVTVETIPDNLAEKAYLIYTHAPMTKAKRNEYQSKADEYVTSGKWQKVEVAAWQGGTAQQEHCLNHTTLNGAVNQTATFGANRWKDIIKKFGQMPKAFASIALYDPVGITLKLNEYRNEAYIPVDDFLEKKDKGVSNQRKVHAVQMLDTLKGSLEKKAMGSIAQNVQNTASRIDYFKTTDGNIIRRIDDEIAQAKKEKDFQRVAELEKARLIKIEDIKRKENAQNTQLEKDKESRLVKLKADWQICDDNINYKEVDDFKKAAVTQFNVALELANKRSKDHLNWINSNFLHNGLDAYDPKDLQSGCAFKAHVACLIFGMEGSIQSEKQLDEWMKKPQFERKNLFIRGLYGNQDEIKEKHNEMAKSPNDTTALGIKLLKTLTDFMKKMDTAWDEYARVQLRPEKLEGLKKYFTYTEKKIMFYISNLSRAFFRFGVGTKAENLFVNSLCKKLLYPQLGKLTEELRYNELFYAIDPETFKKGVVQDITHADASKMSKLTKAEVDQLFDKLINDAKIKSAEPAKKITEVLGKEMKDATNNYHQVRASGILIIIESFNLFYLFNSYDMEAIASEKKIALLASITGLTALALDIFYGMAKALRETATQTINKSVNSAAIKGAANIQRGAIKFASGCLGATTGVLSAVMDFQNFNKQLDKSGGSALTLAIIYLSRGVTSAFGSVFLSLWATITYLEPVLKYVQHKKCSPLLMNLGERAIIKKLATDTARAALLRVVAWAGGIGLVLTVLEVAIYIYIEFHKLETWCKTSTFRKNKNEKIMSEKDEAEGYQALFV